MFQPRDKVEILTGIDAGKQSVVAGVHEWTSTVGKPVVSVAVVVKGGVRGYRQDQLRLVS